MEKKINEETVQRTNEFYNGEACNKLLEQVRELKAAAYEFLNSGNDDLVSDDLLEVWEFIRTDFNTCAGYLEVCTDKKKRDKYRQILFNAVDEARKV